jgi:hypothetical protein
MVKSEVLAIFKQGINNILLIIFYELRMTDKTIDT